MSIGIGRLDHGLLGAYLRGPSVLCETIYTIHFYCFGVIRCFRAFNCFARCNVEAIRIKDTTCNTMYFSLFKNRTRFLFFIHRLANLNFRNILWFRWPNVISYLTRLMCFLRILTYRAIRRDLFALFICFILRTRRLQFNRLTSNGGVRLTAQ